MALSERDLTRIMEEILETTQPSKRISQIRNVWHVVKRLKRSGRTYKQIAENLLPRLGLTMTYRQFLSACYAVQCEEASGKRMSNGTRKRKPPAKIPEPVAHREPTRTVDRFLRKEEGGKHPKPFGERTIIYEQEND